MNKFCFLDEIVHVEKAFLYGKFEEEIYIECPPRIKNVNKIDCIALRKYIYDLIQEVKKL